MDVVVMYEDQDGRVLSDPFVKLPTRRELPDYYEIIKKPVDITKIQNKIDDGKVKLDTSNWNCTVLSNKMLYKVYLLFLK